MKTRVLSALAIVSIVSTAHADDSVNAWTQRLRSANRAESFIAQVYVAHAGTEALPELNTLARTRDNILRERLRIVLDLMLKKTVTPGEVRKYERLWQLLEPDLRKATDASLPLVHQKHYDSGAVGLTSPGTIHPKSKPRQAVESVLALGGFAVPVAVDLLSDEQPGSRMYGVEILGRLDAVSQLSELRHMMKDDGAISVSRGCYWDDTTVGAEVPYWLAAGALRRAAYPDDEHTVALKKYAVAFEAESFIFSLPDSAGLGPYDLVNQLRRDAGTMDAVSWDDYWSRAKPVLESLLAPGDR
ncbi:MAG TPA: hypothetical protein VJZ00_04290 [Thermoanaerobaculia bacterium]|nr:hypothetical protein [Thermoanaerobaculia bacterium]